ncbi:flagellar biosynthesis repressor FlbT [Aurantimonas sp. Leaf443]|uniref:flagellar biosynthesis repressor FlbT n=1 Tax=Aurantimonas sp. Leaf443 TaxID=1736378 RepID=UPI0006FC64C8|nr:flagellar biosynthesis repressor FlbT [Aurantimonas sp. Leaf443]KQT82449.1 hypothetical protein ASG48_15355 [Aurantimonas sp. Leaf443]
MTLRLSLRAGERIFINGAVMRVDRKTSLELLNDVTFLLESHVMQAEDARTPLRQLYFLVQMILIDPANSETAVDTFRRTYVLLMAAFSNQTVRSGLMDVAECIDRNRAFEALKIVRGLIPLEDMILAGQPVPAQPPIARQLAFAAGARR